MSINMGVIGPKTTAAIWRSMAAHGMLQCVLVLLSFARGGGTRTVNLKFRNQFLHVSFFMMFCGKLPKP
jgi:hypothetical protein